MTVHEITAEDFQIRVDTGALLKEAAGEDLQDTNGVAADIGREAENRPGYITSVNGAAHDESHGFLSEHILKYIFFGIAVLLVTGIAGLGIWKYAKRKNRKTPK
ncbi:MAG: hypothetical protein FWB75_02950 [Oscillospiraceae bacterium]|nr:hypothetical protein [Oscillospiraceae bacterium]